MQFYYKKKDSLRPMSGRIIDLSQKLSPHTRELIQVRIKYINHKSGADDLGLGIAWKVWEKGFFLTKLYSFLRTAVRGELIRRNQFPGGEGLSMEKVYAMSHCGTHIDAPAHYGAKLTTIDLAPLNLLYDKPGVLIDLQAFQDQEEVGPNDLKQALERINYRLQPEDIVLMKTGMDQYWGTERYYTRYPGIAPAAIEHFLALGIKVIGLDTFAVDLPQYGVAKRYWKSKDSSDLWPAHILGRVKPYYIIENLCNLHQIPANSGFRVTALPIKLEAAGAAWARVVAVV